MSYARKFKDDFIVTFDGEVFSYSGVDYSIYGVTCLNASKTVLQIRDELLLVEVLSQKQLPFQRLCELWERITPELMRMIRDRRVSVIALKKSL